MRFLLAPLVLLLPALLPAGAAVVVGASGQCWDADGTGGQDQIQVDTDAPQDATLPTFVGAVENAYSFAEGGCTAPNTCDPEGCKAGQRKDYVEAHAAGQQVCYDNNVRTDGSCPTSPSGP